MRVRVTRPYEQPCADPISVRAGARVFPDAERKTGIPGWLWCVAEDGRVGWTPRAWLRREGGVWRIDRDFDAIELTVESGELLEVLEEESGFYWAANSGGDRGWVPCEHVTPAQGGEFPDYVSRRR